MVRPTILGDIHECNVPLMVYSIAHVKLFLDLFFAKVRQEISEIKSREYSKQESIRFRDTQLLCEITILKVPEKQP